MQDVRPFNAHRGSGQLLTTTAASQPTSIAQQDTTVRVTNTGATNPGFVRISSSKEAAATQVCTANDTIIMPGQTVNLHKQPDADTLTYLWSTAATTLYVQTGNSGT